MQMNLEFYEVFWMKSLPFGTNSNRPKSHSGKKRLSYMGSKERTSAG